MSVACPHQHDQNSQFLDTGHVDVDEWVSVACPSHQFQLCFLSPFCLPVLCKHRPISFAGFGTELYANALQWESVAFPQHHLLAV